ncbi:MAG: HupE/UreJ family protein [Bacteroidetes bacterium]|nr:HupE/UreJ family protein [Bacteroidota bacterium]
MDFNLWFTTGVQHIADLEGYDHMLFLLSLCGIYSIKEWKKVLILVTAFTVGHSITLALSVTDIFTVKSGIIELLIPVTIMLSAISNILYSIKNKEFSPQLNYFMALFFGLIHGLGFSYLLKSLLGNSESILPPLFAFNIGLEAGQLIIVVIILFISLFLTEIIKLKNKTKNISISALAFVMGTMMLIERIQSL